MDGVLTPLVLDELSHRLVLAFWNKDVGGAGSGVDYTPWVPPLIIKSCLLLRGQLDAHELYSTPRQSALQSSRSGEALLDRSLAGNRFTASLLGIFSILAVSVAALGLYGVISSAVTYRTKELGIRIALGARRGQTVSLVMSQGIRLSLLGAALGALVSLGFIDLIASQLFQINPRDPITFGSAAATLILVALLASYLPARRATKLDPVRALQAN